MKLFLRNLILLLILYCSHLSEGNPSVDNQEEPEIITFTFDSIEATHPWFYSGHSDTSNPLWFNYFQDWNNISSHILNYFNEWDITTSLLYDPHLNGAWTSFTSEYCYDLRQDCFGEDPAVSFTKDSSYNLVGLEIRFAMHGNATLRVYEGGVEVKVIQGSNYNQWTSLNVSNISFLTQEVTVKLNADDKISGSYILLDKITVYAEVPAPPTTTTPEKTTSSPTTTTATTTVTPPEPWLMAFEMDTEENNQYPWRISAVSYYPVTHYYFSYFKDWKNQSDTAYLKDYFEEHNMESEFENLKTNLTLGFWTTFTNQYCFPGTTTTTERSQIVQENLSTEETKAEPTVTTPEPYCFEYEGHDKYPHIELELWDPERYILKSLEITYAKHQNSNLILSYSCSINGSMVDSVEFPIEQTDDECIELEGVPGWNCFSLDFNEHPFKEEDCDNFNHENDNTIIIKINLAITSDELNSGEFIIVDQIVVTALDRNGEPPTTPTTVPTTTDPTTTFPTTINPTTTFPTTINPTTTFPTTINPTTTFPTTTAVTTISPTTQTLPTISTTDYSEFTDVTVPITGITEVTPEPFPMTFEIDNQDDSGYPWYHSQPSIDPVTLHWFSYCKTWTIGDANHLIEYFDEHLINITSLINEETGFWTSFSKKLCFPGNFRVSSDISSGPPYDCPYDDEYPQFGFEFNSAGRYIFETLEITYALHIDSQLNISLWLECGNGDEIADQWIIEQTEFTQVPVWEHYTYSFTETEMQMNENSECFEVATVKIKVDLVTSSDDFNSGEFVIIDKIVIKALDVGQPTTTTYPLPTTTTTTEQPIITTDDSELTDSTTSSSSTTEEMWTTESTTEVEMSTEDTTFETPSAEPEPSSTTVEEPTSAEPNEESTAPTTSTPDLSITFECDVANEIEYPWSLSKPSTDPVTLYWFSYFESWDTEDTTRVDEYFDKHSINTTGLINDGIGFWTTFSKRYCSPGTFPPTTSEATEESIVHKSSRDYIDTSPRVSFNNLEKGLDLEIFASTNSPTPEPDCFPDSEHPFFKFDVSSEIRARYILETLEITYAMHYDSKIEMSIRNPTGAIVDKVTLTQVNDDPSWESFTYTFSESLDETAFSNISEIHIELVISSEELHTGEYIIVDKIVITAWELETTTENPNIGTSEPVSQITSTDSVTVTSEETEETGATDDDVSEFTDEDQSTSPISPSEEPVTEVSTDFTRSSTPSRGSYLFSTMLTIFTTLICIAVSFRRDD